MLGWKLSLRTERSDAPIAEGNVLALGLGLLERTEANGARSSRGQRHERHETSKLCSI